jgi:hypothetical protein
MNTNGPVNNVNGDIPWFVDRVAPAASVPEPIGPADSVSPESRQLCNADAGAQHAENGSAAPRSPIAPAAVRASDFGDEVLHVGRALRSRALFANLCPGSHAFAPWANLADRDAAEV